MHLNSISTFTLVQSTSTMSTCWGLRSISQPQDTATVSQKFPPNLQPDHMPILSHNLIPNTNPILTVIVTLNLLA